MLQHNVAQFVTLRLLATAPVHCAARLRRPHGAAAASVQSDRRDARLHRILHGALQNDSGLRGRDTQAGSGLQSVQVLAQRGAGTAPHSCSRLRGSHLLALSADRRAAATTSAVAQHPSEEASAA